MEFPMTLSAIARATGRSRETLRRMAAQGLFPAYAGTGNRREYLLSEVRAALLRRAAPATDRRSRMEAVGRQLLSKRS